MVASTDNCCNGGFDRWYTEPDEVLNHRLRSLSIIRSQSLSK
jgi:hypothetical protein